MSQHPPQKPESDPKYCHYNISLLNINILVYSCPLSVENLFFLSPCKLAKISDECPSTFLTMADVFVLQVSPLAIFEFGLF